MKYCAEGRDQRFGVIEFVVGVDVTPEFKAAVAGVGEAGWHDLHRQADGRRTSTGQQWAEVPFVPNWIGHSKHSPEYRFIAIREPLRNPPLPGMAGQLNLAVPTMEMPGGGWYKVFGLVTNRDIDPEELELLPGSLTPGLGEILVRLGAWLPFGNAQGLLAYWARLHPLREARVRRPTEAAGATYVAIQAAAARALEAGWELPGSGSARLVLAVDRAMVPLVGGEWAAVQTLVIGEVAAEPGSRKGMSYFPRLSDAASFAQQALAETGWRGVGAGGAGALVSDGAEWIPGFGDLHGLGSARILDFPHPAKYVADLGRGAFGETPALVDAWQREQLRRRKAEGAGRVLPDLRIRVQGGESDQLSRCLA